MADPRGAVTLAHGDETYTMRFSINALCAFEEHVGKSLMQVFSEGEKAELSVTMIRSLVWAGLTEDKPDLTLKEAGEIIQNVGLEPMTEAMMEAVQASFPDAGGDRAGNPQGAKAPTK